MKLDATDIRDLTSLLDRRNVERQTLWSQAERLYATRFWTNLDNALRMGAMRLIETTDAHAYVETLVAGMFTRAPAITLGEDPEGRGDPELAEAAVNQWMRDQRAALEAATRMALIYPFSTVKIVYDGGASPIRALRAVAVPPWEVLLDEDARCWEEQRYVVHRYQVPLATARERYGDLSWKPETPKSARKDLDKRATSRGDPPEAWKAVTIIEVYDVQEGTIQAWSPSLERKDKTLLYAPLPEHPGAWPKGRALPILPLFFAAPVDRPLEGLSKVWLLRSQFEEKVVLRTYRANAVRRDARTYLVRQGALDDEAEALLEQGVDGAVLRVDAPQNVSLKDVIHPVAHAPVSPAVQDYENIVDRDIQRGSALSPLAFGQPIRTTATEVTALAAYAANEVGKLARERDVLIERLAGTWLGMTVPLLEDAKERVRLVVGERRRALAPDDLVGDFNVAALDQGSTPQSEQVRARTLVELLPTLKALGVPDDVLLREVARTFDLPRSFVTAARRAARERAAPSGRGSVRVADTGAVAPQSPPQTPADEALAAVLAAAGGGGGGAS